MEKLKLLDLFSGIGGFSLGLERSGGFETVAFCEIDPFCQRVLAKHWPEVPCYDDVRTLTADRLAADGISVDAICGGFPCQDISTAGKGAGIDGDRSGLWGEIVRLAGELRPRYVIVENVSNLLAGPPERPGAWFGRVLGDLATLGLDAEWHSIPASAVGAHHRRDRVWIVAYPADILRRSDARSMAPGKSKGRRQAKGRGIQKGVWQSGDDGLAKGGSPLADADSLAPVGSAIAREERAAWNPEPALGRVVDGISYSVVEPELRALGNAVVPQVPELIGRAIIRAMSPQVA